MQRLTVCIGVIGFGKETNPVAAEWLANIIWLGLCVGMREGDGVLPRNGEGDFQASR